MSKIKNPLPPKRWAYLKALRPDEPRMFHLSCVAYMAANPAGPMLPSVPIVEKGDTYNVGRNKAKRERRALSASLKA